MTVALSAALLTTVGSASAAPAATVSGPIPGSPTAFDSTTFPLSQVGYRQAEFFFTGSATSYVPTSALNLDGDWSVAPADGADYVTRATVYRPQNPKRFNGTVYVSWLNVTAGRDIAADWLWAHNEVLRQGAINVLVSAQKVGVDYAKARAPERYGTLSHPGDSFSYDVFSQVGQAILDRPGKLLGGLTPRRLIAVGESQSSNRLNTYVNAVQPIDDVYDGFFLWSRINQPGPLSQAPQADVPAPAGSRVRADQVPVLDFITETDALGLPAYALQQPDSPLYRAWYPAGSTHADAYGLVNAMDASDRFRMALYTLDKTLNPTRETHIPATCPAGTNPGVMRYVAEAGYANLDRWLRSGRPPARAPRFEYESLSPVTIARDSYGNALAGIRTPFLDAPVATISGVGVGGFPCALFGEVTPFSAEQLDALYPSHGKFVNAWAKATLNSASKGWIVPNEVVPLIAAAATSDIGR